MGIRSKSRNISWVTWDNLSEKPCTTYIVGIWWNRGTHNLGEVWVPISQVLPIERISLHFPMLQEIYDKTHFWRECYRVGMWWKKSSHTLENYGYLYGCLWVIYIYTPWVSLAGWVLVHFPMLWEIDEKVLAFLIWWDLLILLCILTFGNWCSHKFTFQKSSWTNDWIQIIWLSRKKLL